MTARRTAHGLALFVAGAFCPDAHAYRPFISTDAAVVAPRHIELELGYVAVEHEESENTFVTPQTVLNVGLLPRLELVGEFEVRMAEGSSAEFADPAVFLKAVVREGVLQDQLGPSVAVEAGPTLPAVSADEDGLGWETVAIVSAPLGALLTHSNLGGGLTRSGNALGVWGLIAELPVGDGLRVVSELNGETTSGTSPEHRLLLGCIWESASLPLALDVGARRGLNDSAPDWEVTFGMTLGMVL